MNNLMKIAVSLLLLVCLGYNVNAQNTAKGKISGKVIDATTKQAVDYATVSIFKQGGTSPFNGVVTDEKGNFAIEHIAAGDYILKVDFIGYNQKVFAHVVIGPTMQNENLGIINLQAAQNQLQDVVVTAKKPVVENKIDKMVYNPANDLTAQGGVAIDILKKVPQISVDIDGNVELQGNSNIRFLINGKPSSIFGASLSEALQSIPASQIKSIEVITSPGAKYDASGTGGIINIILKSNNVEGINGNVNLSAGTRLENGSFNINARKGKFGLNAFFSGDERINSTTLTNSNRTSYSQTRDTITHLLQGGSNAFKRSGYQSGLGFEWNITKKDQLNASVGFDHFGNNGIGVTKQQQQIVDGAGEISNILSLRNSTSEFSSNTTDLSLDYKKTFDKKDEELDFSVSSSFGSNTSNFSQIQDYLNTAQATSGQVGGNPGKDRETDISVDYTNPFTKSFTLETGAKAVIEHINNSVVTDTLLNDGAYIADPDQTYGFNYDRTVLAYYASGTFSLFHDFINGKAGLRYEHTSTTADFAGTDIPSYGTFAPSFVLQHKLDESQSVKFSYSYRIERPDYGNLNPFYNISDPHNISTGNPDLKPEIGHNYELGYNKSFDKGPNIYISAFYRHNTNDIQSYTTYSDTLTVKGTKYSDVSLTQQYNIGTQTTEGANVYVSVPVTGKFSLRSNMFFADRITTNPGNPDVSGFTYRVFMNASYEFAHDLAAEVFGNYRSSQRTIQGTNPAFAFYNIAIRKQFWNKNASIGITAANPFNAYISQTSTTSGGNFNQTSIRDVPFRSFGISLSYKFGKLDFKKDKDDEPDDVPPQNKSQAPEGKG
jgi:ferric enterobactin receptor